MGDIRPLPTDPVTFLLNGEPVSVSVAPGERLSHTLRERCATRDVKIGCNAGDCGACTLLLEGQAVCACLTPTHQAAGMQIETLQGLVVTDPVTRNLQTCFAAHGAAQCGICTPGMMVSATALLRECADPTQKQVQDALGGVLCRCTGYSAILSATLAAAKIDFTTPCNMVQHDTEQNIDHAYIGRPMPRLDGPSKTSGIERFGDDIGSTQALLVRVIRSPYAHARFEFGDTAAFLSAQPSFICILTADDVPGENRFGVIPGFEDQPVFAEGVARFRGEAVAALVGAAEMMETFDLMEFPISWEELPAITEPNAALAAGAPPLHPAHLGGNLLCSGLVQCGDAETALARADRVVEGHYRSGFVEHAYIEPEAGCAEMVAGRLELHVCTQAPFMNRNSLARILALEESEIRIIPTAVGGGFGSKLDLSVHPFLALAALKTAHPVRMAYSRTESMQSSTKRHPSDIKLRIGATNDGRLCGFDFTGDFNTGAYASWGPTVANRVPIHAGGPYVITDYRAHARGVYTNSPPAGAFRGFGVPQSALAQESLFDKLAEELGLDPLEFRIINALQSNLPTVTGQVFTAGVGIKSCLIALRPHWIAARAKASIFNEQAQAQGRILRRGVGVGSGWYGCGNTSLRNPSTIKAGICADGAVHLHQGATDIGQGSNTVIAQIFATELGIPIEKINLNGPDTDHTPDAGKTSASRQTFITGNAARLCGIALRAKLLRLCNVASDKAHLEFVENGIIHIHDGTQHHEINLAVQPKNVEGFVLSAEESYDPPTQPLDENGQGHPYAQYGYAAQMAEIEVDISLGIVNVLQFYAAHDVGRAINPILARGQIEGGIAQGIGMALMEEYIPGRTENLHDYLIPTIGDMPEIETILVEEPDLHGPYGAKGLGEHALIPSAPAVLNAIYHATGARLTSVPATPERILTAIRLLHKA